MTFIGICQLLTVLLLLHVLSSTSTMSDIKYFQTFEVKLVGKQIDLNKFYDVESEDETDDWKQWALNLNKNFMIECSGVDMVRKTNEILDRQTQEKQLRDNLSVGQTKTFGKRRNQRDWSQEEEDMFHDAWALIHCRKGDAQLKKGIPDADLDEAVKSYSFAIQHAPNDINIYINRCITLEWMDQIALAEIDARRSLFLDDSNVKALYRMARILKIKGDRLTADIFFELCFKKSYCLAVYQEMVEARYDHLKNELKYSDEEISGCHRVVSLKDCIEYASEAKRGKKRAMNKRNDFIVMDFDAEMSKARIDQIPHNIFLSTGVALYNVCTGDEDIIRNIMSEFGEVIRVGIQPDVITVRYTDFSSPEKAIASLHKKTHAVLSKNRRLTVRFLENEFQTRMRKEIICQKTKSCYAWRTTGCPKGHMCSLSHHEADYRVDLHPYMLRQAGMDVRGLRFIKNSRNVGTSL